MLEKTITVKWFTSTDLLIEAYQQTEFKFSFASSPNKNKIFKQCHPWVKCRDFLPDAVRATITNKSFSIYGFSFDPITNPALDLNFMHMLVYKSNLKSKDVNRFENKMFFGINLLNHYEEIMKINPSILYRTKEDYNSKPVYLFIGNGEWMKSPFLISLYTFLIRLGDKEIVFKNNKDLMDKYAILIKEYEFGKIYDNDIGYLKSMWNILHLILKNKEILTYNNTTNSIFTDSSINNDSFHNMTGIKSLAQATTPIKEINEIIKGLKK
ncbi:MAG: hypothetical protein U9Q27_03555 [Patescibacteria group bacterium]|nr:hypothetical protein [Patescibacteria group bacterium]